MMVHAQKKGKRGEDLFCAWLKENVGIEVRRNHWQADGHSADISDIPGFLIEVKFRETHSLDDYWHQVVMAANADKDDDRVPIVAFKSNRQKWQFLMPAKLIAGCDYGYVIATERVFTQLIKYALEK